MNCLLTQIIVLARGYDIEGWMDILVLVVIAVVYGLGAIIRSKSKKAEEKAREQQPGKPQRKPSKGGRGILEQFIRDVQKAAEEAKSGGETRPKSQTILQKTAQPQAAVPKYDVKAKQLKPTQPIAAPEKPKSSKIIPKVQPDFETLPELGTSIQSLPEFTTKVVGLPGKRKEGPAEVVESIHLSEVLSDYEDPEELKRAILHYEILGRPLALRDTSRNIIGL